MEKNVQVLIRPNWPSGLSGNTVVEVLAYTTTGFEFSAVITGPGLPAGGLQTGVIQGSTPFFSPSNVIDNYEQGIHLNYNVDISCNTTFTTQVSHEKEYGVKPGTELNISYQRTLFCNDSGDDQDWNDLVVIFSVFNQSTD